MMCVSPGHVCGVWEFWPWCGGPSSGLRSVWPVLPSILCRHQGNNSSWLFSFPHKHKTLLSNSKKRMWPCGCSVDRSLRWCSVKAGVAWSAQCARPAAKPRIQAACCFVTTVTSATTPTAWIHHCRTCPKTAGSANGEPSLTLFPWEFGLTHACTRA